jgi:hypothetical protein
MPYLRSNWLSDMFSGYFRLELGAKTRSSAMDIPVAGYPIFTICQTSILIECEMEKN